MTTDTQTIVRDHHQLSVNEFRCSACCKNSESVNWTQTLLVLAGVLTVTQLTLVFYVTTEISQLKLRVSEYEEIANIYQDWAQTEGDVYGSSTEEVFNDDLHLAGVQSGSTFDQNDGVQTGTHRSKRATDKRHDIAFDIQQEPQESQHQLRHHGNRNHGNKRRLPVPQSWESMQGDGPSKSGKGNKKRSSKKVRIVHIHLSGLEQVLEIEDEEDWEYVPHTKGYWSQAGYRPDPSDRKLRYWKVRDMDSQAKKAMEYNDNGEVEIKQDGLYLIYSQMLYYNSGPISAQAVTVLHKGSSEEDRFIQCTMSSSPATGGEATPDNSRYRTCHTSGAISLKEGDRVFIKALYVNRTVEFKQESCFWGLVKLR